ncbi:MAG: ABC transporter ATP-binding protein [Oscillospiraceae bacterium]|jgi:branched-chain amino acid transport system ATP-binding protein|nr:ABC transporter ATP-binding protein [Oscillospiraceae bacterium]MCI9548502.1 ABC transporter ATP-binding protein [Oscillospiraceae bacterium]
MSHFLEARDLTVHYGNVNALRGVNFHVDQGEIVTLIGSNGAGKTSSLMAISNLIQGTRRGTVEFGGEDITHLAPSKIVKLGISHVPEGRHIFPKLTVEENLLMGTFGAKRYDKARAAAVLEEIYQMFPRLRERRTQLGGTLSGGEQQMLAIGRGLMFSPKVLMLDEPSLELAPLVVKEIFELILDIRDRGTTVLLIEQNAGLALQIADRGYVLENGSITLTDTGEALLHNESVIKAYLGI